MNILTQTLKKVGKKYEELSPQAKTTYDRWEQILSGGKMKPENMLNFLKAEREVLINELINNEMMISSSSLFNLRLIDANSLVDRAKKDRISVFDLVINMIESPEKNAKILEAQLKRNLPNLKKTKL